MKLNLKLLALCLLIVYTVAFAGSLFTASNVNTDWYKSIRPAITPPNFVFPIVWNFLFFLIALSLYFAWKNSEKKEKKKIALAFGTNFVLNILWSGIFFSLKLPVVSFFEILILLVSILFMILVVKKTKIAALLLGPYFLWVAFASVLNFLIAF